MLNTTTRMLALATLLSTGAFARSKTSKMPDQVQCSDGSVGTAGRGACSHHGGIARTTQSTPTQGAANRALPPTDRAPDNTASKSPWSIFGGKRKEPAPAPDTSSSASRTAPAESRAPAPQGRSAPTARAPRQSNAPASAAPTAKCRDGSLSYSAHHSGSCSSHGGVAEWLDKR